MPGILDLYEGFAKSHVQLYKKRGKVEMISRAKIELQILDEIEKAELPIEYKLSWYYAVLVSSKFDAFWKAVSIRHKLPKSCTTRYFTDEALLEYEAPTEDEAQEGAEDEVEDDVHDEVHDDVTASKNISPTSVPQTSALQTPALTTDQDSRSSTPDSDDSSRSSTPERTFENDPDWFLPKKYPLPPKCTKCNTTGHPDRYCPEDPVDEEFDWSSDASEDVIGGHEAKVLAKRLFYGLPIGLQSVSDPLPGLHNVHEDPPAALGDLNGLAREEGGEGAYEDSPPKSKGKGKAEATPTVKGASKPKGITKKKAMPKKKEQTPAQLKTAAAKTIEPAKPKVTKTASTKKASTPPSKAATTPAQASTEKTSTTPSQAATTPAQASTEKTSTTPSQAAIASAQASTEKTSTTPSQVAITSVQASTGNASTTPSQAAITSIQASTGKASTTPSQAATIPAQALNANNKKTHAATVPDELDMKIAEIQADMGPAQAQGIKRMWELFPDDDEDDSPANKKAKTGVPASAHGGRKMATLKKSDKKKSLGSQRGVCEY